MTDDTLLSLGPRALFEVLSSGHPLDPESLDDTEYDGTSLGLPRFVDRVAWKKFRKVFWRAEPGRLCGWNVRCEQTPLDTPWVAILRDSKPVTYGYFSVRSPPIQGALRGLQHAPLIDYSLGARSEWAMRAVRDPLVALDAGSPDRLLGFSYLQLGPAMVHTPSFFLLRRGDKLTHAGEPRGGWRSV